MVSGISGINNFDNSEYHKKSIATEAGSVVLASAAAGCVTAMLPVFSKSFLKQIKREHENNANYKDVFYKAVENSGLTEKGLYVRSLEFKNKAEEMAYFSSGKRTPQGEIKAGLNADYTPELKRIRINNKKTTISGFHELGHAMNHLNGGFGKLLQKMRAPGIALAGLMETIALFNSSNPKRDKKTFWNFIIDNCGKIAFAAILPIVAEEALASHKGIKMAKEAGLSDKLVKNLRKFYGKALLSYIGYATVTGLSVFVSSKIMQKLT